MPRQYKKRDKKAEAKARPRQASPDWEERKKRIREKLGVKLPELTAIVSETAGSLKLSDLISDKEPYKATTSTTKELE